MNTFLVDSRIVASHLGTRVVVSWYEPNGQYGGQERTTLGEIKARLSGATQTYKLPGRMGYRLATGEVARIRFL